MQFRFTFDPAGTATVVPPPVNWAEFTIKGEYNDVIGGYEDVYEEVELQFYGAGYTYLSTFFEGDFGSNVELKVEKTQDGGQTWSTVIEGYAKINEATRDLEKQLFTVPIYDSTEKADILFNLDTVVSTGANVSILGGPISALSPVQYTNHSVQDGSPRAFYGFKAYALLQHILNFITGGTVALTSDFLNNGYSSPEVWESNSSGFLFTTSFLWPTENYVMDYNGTALDWSVELPHVAKTGANKVDASGLQSSFDDGAKDLFDVEHNIQPADSGLGLNWEYDLVNGYNFDFAPPLQNPTAGIINTKTSTYSGNMQGLVITNGKSLRSQTSESIQVTLRQVLSELRARFGTKFRINVENGATVMRIEEGTFWQQSSVSANLTSIKGVVQQISNDYSRSDIQIKNPGSATVVDAGNGVGGRPVELGITFDSLTWRGSDRRGSTSLQLNGNMYVSSKIILDCTSNNNNNYDDDLFMVDVDSTGTAQRYPYFDDYDGLPSPIFYIYAFHYNAQMMTPRQVHYNLYRVSDSATSSGREVTLADGREIKYSYTYQHNINETTANAVLSDLLAPITQQGWNMPQTTVWIESFGWKPATGALDITTISE